MGATVNGDLSYHFGDFTFRDGTAELRRAGQPVALTNPARAALQLLLRRHGCVVMRGELLKHVWPDSVVSEGSLRLAIWEVRQALEESGGPYVETVRGQGYRFLGRCTTQAAEASTSLRPAGQAISLGRSRELSRLLTELERGLTLGRAGVVMGPAGIGKSRLVRDTVPLAASLGYTPLWAHGDPEVGAPLGPWLQIVVQALDSLSVSSRKALELRIPRAFQFVSALSTHSASLAGPARADGRSALFDELTRLLMALSHERVFLMVVEDLQCLDEASLAFFAQLARQLVRGRGLLLATCRGALNERSRTSHALRALQREPDNFILELASLSLGDTSGILAEILDSTSLDQARQVHALTLGNPLFTGEVARLLRDLPVSARPSLFSSANVQLRSVIERRLGLLDARAQDTIAAAAILEPEFGLSELTALLRDDLPNVLDSLEGCSAQGVLARASNGRFSFAHPLIRAAAYARVPELRRAELHKRAGLWLEKQAGSLQSPSATAQLAHHFRHAALLGCAHKAVRYLRKAAEQAIEVTAYSDALTAYDLALDCTALLPNDDVATQLELTIERANAARLAGTPAKELKELFARCAQAATEILAPELLARAALAYTGHTADTFVPTRFAGAADARERQLLRRALDAIGPAPSVLRVLLLCSLAYALLYEIDASERVAVCEEAIHLARTLDEPWLLARALVVRSYACASPDKHAERLASCSELINLTVRYDLKALELEARVMRAICLLEDCAVEAAATDEARALHLARELERPIYQSRAELPALLRAFGSGQLDLAEQMTSRAHQVNPDNQLAATLLIVRTASLRMLRQGLTPEALALRESLVTSYPEIAGFRCALASMHISFGNAELGRQYFDSVAEHDFAALPFDINWLAEMSLLADAAVNLDDAPRSRLVYERLAPYGGRWMFYAGEAAPAGPVAYWLAELSATMRETALAERWLARARAACEQHGAPMFLQYCAMAEARLHMLCRPDGAAGAWRLLREVETFADRHDLRWLRLSAASMQQKLAAALRHEHARHERRSN